MSGVRMSLLEKIQFIKQINNNFFQYVSELIAKYGEVFTVSLPHVSLHLITSPQHIKYVFDQTHDFTRAAALPVAREMTGEYALILSNNYEIWKKDRNTLTALFQPTSIRNYTEIMVDVINGYLNKWEDYIRDKKPLNMDHVATSITFDILLKTLYGGIHIDVPYMAQLIHKASVLNKKGPSTWFGYIPRFHYFAVRSIKKKACAIGDSMVEQCLASPNPNLVSLIADAYKNDETPEERKLHLRGEALGIAFAGQETSTGALVQALVFVSFHPQVQAQLYEEVDRILEKRLPTYDDVAKLIFTKAVIMETLRLEPPIYGLGRKAIKDTQIGHLKIKKGDVIGISIYHLHRLTRYWENPECFDPTRFLKPLDDYHKSAYIPFGLGPHACIGQQFAMHEMILSLAMIAQRYTLWLTPESNLKREEKSISNKLNKELTMTVHKRFDDNTA